MSAAKQKDGKVASAPMKSKLVIHSEPRVSAKRARADKLTRLQKSSTGQTIVRTTFLLD